MSKTRAAPLRWRGSRSRGLPRRNSVKGFLEAVPILFCLGFGGRDVFAAGLKAGVAVADITPPVGYRMCGYFYERLSTGTHDPLEAKALYLEQGDQQVALVFCDLIGVPQEVTDRARELAGHSTGLPPTHILVAATHSHTGPLYFDALRTFLHERAAAGPAGTDPREAVDYPAALAEKVAGAIRRAKAAAGPVGLEAGLARRTNLSFNRRYHMKDGTVLFNPGKKNPAIDRPAGPIDPDVAVLLFRDPKSRRARASLTVFALHLDTRGGTEYGADYPFYLERTLRDGLGADLISLFGTGTCGDINHIDVSSESPQKGGEETERIGAALAATVLKTVPGLEPAGKPSLAARYARITAPLQEFTPDEVARARERMPRIGGKDLPFLEQVEAYKIMDVEEMKRRRGPALSLEVQAFRLDDRTALVGLPGEVFVELGLAIKQASPFPNTLVVELCNDDIGYVPTRKAFAEGSYEVVNSRLQCGGGEQLVDAALRLLRELKPAAGERRKR